MLSSRRNQSTLYYHFSDSVEPCSDQLDPALAALPICQSIMIPGSRQDGPVLTRLYASHASGGILAVLACS